MNQKFTVNAPTESLGTTSFIFGYGAEQFVKCK